MTEHEFESNLVSIYAQPPKFDDEQEFASRLVLGLEQTHRGRIALLWIFGAIGAFASCYWIGMNNLLTLLNDMFDLLFATVDGLSFYTVALIASVVSVAMHRVGTYRSR